MNKLRFLFLTIISFTILTSYAQNSQEQKQNFFHHWKNDSVFRNANIGLFVMDAANGETLLETTPQISMTPASIMKVITSATAMELLGSQYQFETTVTYSGKINEKKGVLNGDLIIVGGADPALGSMYFEEHYANFMDEWINAIRAKGITEIKGDLIADASIYEKQSIPDTWTWEDLGNYYGAGACALTAFDNLYQIVLKSGKVGTLTQLVKTIPPVPNLQIENNVMASAVNSDQAYVFGSPFESKRVIRGTIPANRSQFKVKASMPDPPLLLATQLKNKLKANHIKLGGTVKVSYQSCKTGHVICQTVSPPLHQIIDVLNHESVNLFAEHLCKHIAYVKTGKGSTDEGVKQIKEFWEEQGIDMNGLFMADGSGLSRFDAVTPRHMCQILNFMNKSQDAEIFKNSLPSAGKSGTLHVFSAEKFPDGMLRAKSGSMTRVRCYAGFLRTQSGRELIFTIMLNNFSCSQRQAIHKIEDFLAELSND